MAAGLLLSVVLNGAQRIDVHPSFCKRTRHRRGRCERCLEICPENAISLDPGPRINKGCSVCGLCLNVCPMGVFQDELHRDEYLLSQAMAYLDKGASQRPDREKRLFFHCNRAEDPKNNSIHLPCLGRVTANILLGAAIFGFDEAVLTKGICAQCEFRRGQSLLANSLTIARILLEGVGLELFAIIVEEKERAKTPLLSRREIFSEVSKNVKHKMASFLHNRERAIRYELNGDPQRKVGKRLPAGRKLLLKLLKQRGLVNTMVVKYSPEFLGGNIKIVAERCDFCGTCVALCPTGAISEKSESALRCLYFNTSLCTNCSLCKEACPRNAIDFEEDFVLGDLFEGGGKVVARIGATSCFLCGDLIRDGEVELCPTCRKRQVLAGQGHLYSRKET